MGLPVQSISRVEFEADRADVCDLRSLEAPRTGQAAHDLNDTHAAWHS
jgi:hypothetical protein